MPKRTTRRGASCPPPVSPSSTTSVRVQINHSERRGQGCIARSSARTSQCGYAGAMAAQPVRTAEEWFERVRHAGPPTPDEVTSGWLRSRRSAPKRPLPAPKPQPDGPPVRPSPFDRGSGPLEVVYLIVGAPAAYGAERPTDDADCVMRRDRAKPRPARRRSPRAPPASASAG